jgi:vacuolar-type H+-ATPase subunit H
LSDNRGLGRFFKGDDSKSNATGEPPQERLSELDLPAGRQSFVNMDDDELTNIAAEDATVIIRAARTRAGKLIEQATETLQQAESEREQIRASCELDARQTREAANVDARKLRAEATATLESAREQATQLLEAAQNDADSQAQENQLAIARLLDEATRQANEVAAEAEVLKLNVENEVALLRADTDQLTSQQILEAQEEAKRLQTEATLAAQSILEKATGDARSLGEDANKTHSETVADAQEILRRAEKQAEQIVSQVRQAAVSYRDTVLMSIDANRKIFDELIKRVAELRSQWFDTHSALTQISNQAGARFADAESSAAEVFARISDTRSTLADTFSEFTLDITAAKQSKETELAAE